MKVTVSLKGRFHGFHLAGELQRARMLGRLITSYPAYVPARYGVGPGQIRSLLLPELLSRAWNRVPAALSARYDPTYQVTELFDRQAARCIPADTDVFVGWASFCRRSLARARQLGAVTVVERGSSHMLHQRELLREEYARLGIAGPLPHPGVVEKELAEYDAADYIAIPSSFVRRSFLAQGVPERKLIQVPYGVDLASFRPVAKQDGTFRVIHCGAVSIQKGVHYLLQAFAELALPNAELWLIGGLGDDIRPFLARYGGANVYHKGPYPQQELYRYFSQGSVFCLASIQEGMAMVLAQAMACGLPVVCSTNTGGEDLLRDGEDGFVVPIRNVETLKARLLTLYEDPARARAMGESALRRVQTGFTWQDYGERTAEAYRRIAGAGGS